MEIAQYIQEGKAVLGIEFGSTRIKAVLIGEQGEPLASGSHNWENRLEDGVCGHTTRRISGMVWQTVIVPWQSKYSKNTS